MEGNHAKPPIEEAITEFEMMENKQKNRQMAFKRRRELNQYRKSGLVDPYVLADLTQQAERYERLFHNGIEAEKSLEFETGLLKLMAEHPESGD